VNQQFTLAILLVSANGRTRRGEIVIDPLPHFRELLSTADYADGTDGGTEFSFGRDSALRCPLLNMEGRRELALVWTPEALRSLAGGDNHRT